MRKRFEIQLALGQTPIEEEETRNMGTIGSARRMLWPVFVVTIACCHAVGVAATVSAVDLLKESGVAGGVAVVVGTSDGAREADLAVAGGGRLVVQGLAFSDEAAAKARRHLLDKQLHGQATVLAVDSKERLPYADNLANLLVVAEGALVTRAEALRVLAPYGVAIFLDRPAGAADRRVVKPWPAAFDEWSHPGHGPSGNPVSRDTAAGPPRHVQWTAGPLWCRTHDSYPSISAMVTAGGRIFYVLDEGPAGVIDSRFPDRWMLYARDAFNGAFLWKVPVKDWFHVVYTTEKTEEIRQIKGPWTRNQKERLIAQRDLVFVNRGKEEQWVALDALTGEQKRAFPGIGIGAVQDGVLVTGRNFIDVQTGGVLWEGGGGVIDGQNVFRLDDRGLRCLDLKTGKTRWTVAAADLGLDKNARLIAAQGRVFLFGKSREPTAVALSQDSGSVLWRKPVPYSAPGGGLSSLFPGTGVAGGRLWIGHGVSLDAATGEDRRTMPLPVNPGHHNRCYGPKYTDRFILTNKRGIEFHDIKAGTTEWCDWVRPTCGIGFMPANGMVYFPPHSCFCYIGEVLYGFYALAPEASTPVPTESRPEAKRLRRGPAFGRSAPAMPASRASDWPAYRHDGQRSGSTACAVPPNLKPLWRSKLGGRLTAPVASGGRVYVGLQDAAAIACLESGTGKELWRFGCGGRVDTPPTIHEGLALLGCTDGWVYALRTENGEEVWRFRVAPAERLVGGFGRVESAWPVKGSVLVQGGKAYAIAGRSSYLDGGIVLVALDPATGKLLHEARVSHASADIPVSSKTLNSGFAMEGGLPEIPIGDGQRVYMRQHEFDNNLASIPLRRITKNGDSETGLHLMSTSDLLDDSGFNRTYWIYARRWPGYYFGTDAPKTGQMLVFDSATTYGVKAHAGKQGMHSSIFFPADKGWLLFADDNSSEPVLDSKSANADKGKPGLIRGPAPKWSAWTPILVRSMVLTGTPAKDVASPTLFVCGPPDVVPSEDPLAAYEGRAGSVLCAVSAADGKTLSELRLDTPPVWDGLIAAEGRLFVALADGSVACLSGRK
jgi:outer membrane protein assembly factor BamB